MNVMITVMFVVRMNVNSTLEEPEYGVRFRLLGSEMNIYIFNAHVLRDTILYVDVALTPQI